MFFLIVFIKQACEGVWIFKKNYKIFEACVCQSVRTGMLLRPGQLARKQKRLVAFNIVIVIIIVCIMQHRNKYMPYNKVKSSSPPTRLPEVRLLHCPQKKWKRRI